MTPIPSWPSHTVPLDLTITEPSFDGNVDTECLDLTSMRINAASQGWATFSFRVSFPEPISRGVPSASECQILVSAPRTQTRHVVRLQRDEATWFGSVNLPRELLAGTATIVAEATARIDGRVRRIAVSEEWSLAVDEGEAPIPKGGAPFTIRWINFSEADAPPQARRNTNAHAVMLLEPEPALLLNDDIRGFRRLLNADTAREERRRVRDLLAGDVTRTAVTAIVRAAIHEVASFDGAELPSRPLERQTFEALAGVMAGVGDAIELCERVRSAETAGGEAWADLWTDIDAGIATLCGYSEALISMTQEVFDA